MKYKAVIFDLDGTLLDTIGDIAGAMNHALKQHGFPTHPEEAYYDMVGWGLDELSERALPEGSDPKKVLPSIREAWLEYYREHPADRTVPYEGAEELLAALVEANVSLGILSNKPHEMAEQTVAALLPRRYFAAIIGLDDRFPPKPDPTSLLHILEQVDVAPEEACMVGDSEVDMETARNAGVGAVAVSWGFRTLETLQDSGAEVTVHSVDELRRYLLNG
ncbi:MAG: HAD family hydrolase [Alkalispirochaetaceae bacterium]